MAICPRFLGVFLLLAEVFFDLALVFLTVAVLLLELDWLVFFTGAFVAGLLASGEFELLADTSAEIDRAKNNSAMVLVIVLCKFNSNFCFQLTS